MDEKNLSIAVKRFKAISTAESCTWQNAGLIYNIHTIVPRKNSQKNITLYSP